MAKEKTITKEIYATRNGSLHMILDMLHLLLCMYVSDMLLENPVFGAALFVAALFWISFIRLYIRWPHGFYSLSIRMSGAALFVVAVSLGVALVVLYPWLMGSASAVVMCAFVVVVISRSVGTDALAYNLPNGTWGRVLRLSLLHLVFFLLFLFLIWFTGLLEGGEGSVAAGTFLVTSIFMICQQVKMDTERRIPVQDARYLKKISSYKIYMSMALTSHVAFFLGVLLYVCYMFRLPDDGSIDIYLIILGWLALVAVVGFIVSLLLRKSSRTARLSLFVGGAVLWIFSSIMLFQTDSVWVSAWWSVFWGVGLASMSAVMTRMRQDFRRISVLIDREITEDLLIQNNIAMENLAMMIAGIIMLCVLTGWSFFVPRYGSQVVVTYFGSGVIILPMLFMVASILFALRQPIGERTREQLRQLEEGGGSGAVKERLQTLLVAKYRKRFGVRIIMAVLRPVLHHKVMGREQVDEGAFPSIFVCNHGEIYGPVSAVLYLPFYFRPWIDDRMLNKTKNKDHIYHGSFAEKKWMPEWLRHMLSTLGAWLASWAFAYFDPIPVSRENLKGLAHTFSASVQAMEEGDNILLFPENPDSTESGHYARDEAGDFFTGFAHMGKAYYKKTGKRVVFYPIFANKTRRTFTIGEGIRYNPEVPAREEKIRIAGELKAAMDQLAGE